jgi:hypothetical protein
MSRDERTGDELYPCADISHVEDAGAEAPDAEVHEVDYAAIM